MAASLETTLRRIASVRVRGEFLRHAAPRRDPFAGSRLGRWGADFPVIYLGRPEQSVIAEAYRHLVDATGVPASSIKPRTLYTVRIDVTNILDLTVPTNREAVGLRDADLRSDVDDYAACQTVADAAHRNDWHGILAPSASGLGQTLAIFHDRIESPQMPAVIAQVTWARLPADPRI